MILANLLRVMLHRASPDKSVLELTDDASMDFVTELLDIAALSEENYRSLVVRNLTLVSLPSALYRRE